MAVFAAKIHPFVAGEHRIMNTLIYNVIILVRVKKEVWKGLSSDNFTLTSSHACFMGAPVTDLALGRSNVVVTYSEVLLAALLLRTGVGSGPGMSIESPLTFEFWNGDRKLITRFKAGVIN